MTEKSARKRLEWNYDNVTNTKKTLFYFIIPGSFLIICGALLKINNILEQYTILLIILGQCILILSQLKSHWADKSSTFEFKEKWGVDRWIKTTSGNFIYYNSYLFSNIEKVYDIYFYGRDFKINEFGNLINTGDYHFELTKERACLHTENRIWRFATKNEIDKYGLDAYTAKILLEKDDDKYQKISK